MDYDILENDKFYEVVLENGKKYKIGKVWAENTQKSLDLGLVDVLDMWLEDNGVFENEEQTALDKLAKENKSNKIVKAKAETPKQKTQKERVKKDNPDKKLLINFLGEALGQLTYNVKTINETKIIEFNYNGKDFKLDLIEKRAKKE